MLQEDNFVASCKATADRGWKGSPRAELLTSKYISIELNQIHEKKQTMVIYGGCTAAFKPSFIVFSSR